MSFNTFKEFEESLQASRARRRVPNVNKTVLKKVILSTEAHNRNQEEQEMWIKHFASKRSEETRNLSSDDMKDRTSAKKRGKKKKKREKFKAEREKRDRNSPKSKLDYHSQKLTNGCMSSEIHAGKNAFVEPDIGPSIDEFLVSKDLKWGHDGYHKLYRDEIHSSSDTDPAESTKKVKKSKKRKKKKEKWVEKDERCSSDSPDEKFERKRRKR